ncbi:hypothetical protein QFC19_001420 [Naganishia cerealis]|uniref:Uncharacterized protein n=1 Tax=Naganishia cerealis TaxID=610337 RepID=A0ACC2WIK4_9TREE|nr:hypothetical protein QFC19_001420 [Naganishia cerealis]
MSKPTLTIITTPASAPATEPPSPVFGDETTTIVSSQKDSSSSRWSLWIHSDRALKISFLCTDDQNLASEDMSQSEDGGVHGSPVTDELVGTPGIAHHPEEAGYTAEQEEGDQVKAWSSTISTSESVPIGLKLPPIPDEATLRDFTKTRSRSRSASRSPTADSIGRLHTGKNEATRSLPSLKAAASQQLKQDQVRRGRSPLAQRSASGPLESSVSPSPSKATPTGFKAFIKRAFGIGKGSNGKEQKKAKAASPFPSAGSKIRPKNASPGTAGSPVMPQENTGRASPVVRRTSPPPLVTPIFSPVSPQMNGLSTVRQLEKQSDILPVVRQPADIPLPPSPYVGQDSPDIPSLGRFTNSSSIAFSTEMTRQTSAESHPPVSPETPAGHTGISLPERTRTSGEIAEAITPIHASPSVNTSLSTVGVVREQEHALARASTPVSRASPGRAGIAQDSSKIMSAVEPQRPPPFSTSPITTSHFNGGPGTATGTTTELHGGVTMSRRVTAEGIGEAKDIMDEKQLMLQEASDNLAAYAAKHEIRQSADRQEEEEAMDSVASDLGFTSRAAQQRKVSPSSTIPKYGRSVSAPGTDRLAPPSPGVASATKDGIGRKLSVLGKASSGTGLTRSGSKLRTSVYGLADSLPDTLADSLIIPQVLHRKETAPQQKRISLSPTMHTMGSIMQEANEIMDQDERNRVESFFMS